MTQAERQPYSEDQAFRAYEMYGDQALDLMKGRLLCEETLQIVPVVEEGGLASVTYIRPELVVVAQQAAHSEAA